MTNFTKWARIGVAAAAAAGFAAASSSTAWAQYDDPDYCYQYAWDACSWVGGVPTMPSAECVDREYQNCMNGGYDGLASYKQD